MTLTLETSSSGPPAATSLTVSNATGPYGGPTTLSATLTSAGSGVGGKNINFYLNGNSVGTAMTDSGGLATLSGVSLSGINSGDYPAGISASFSGDANYSISSGSGTLIIYKAAATVAIINLSQTYTDSPLALTAITVPAGLSVVWTGAPQTAAGSYPVTATIDDSNYQGSVSGTFTINKAAPIPTRGKGTSLFPLP